MPTHVTASGLYRPASQTTTSRCVPDLPYIAVIGGAAVLALGAAEAATRAVLKTAPGTQIRPRMTRVPSSRQASAQTRPGAESPIHERLPTTVLADPLHAITADIACRVTAEPTLSVTMRRSGARGTRRHDGIGDLPSEAGLLMLVAAGDTFAHPCSSVCSRDAMDRGSGARRRETPRLPCRMAAGLDGLPGPSWTPAT